MPGKMSDPDMMAVKIGKSGHNTGEDEESVHDADEDREIRARCRRQNEGIESGKDAVEIETK